MKLTHQQVLGGEKYQLYSWLHVVIVCCFINFLMMSLYFIFIIVLGLSTRDYYC
jgi:hypothetical protein